MLFRSYSAGGSSSSVVSNSSTTNYTLTGLTANATYTFSVQAITDAGTGPASLTATALLKAVASSISSTSITSIGDRTATISWTDPTAGSQNFKVETSTVSGVWNLVADGLTTNTYTLTALVNGTTYLVRVTNTTSGTQDAAAPVTITPRTSASAVTGLSGASSLNAFSVTWNPVTGADLGGLPLIGYRVTLQGPTNNLISVETITATSKTFNAGLSVSDTYTVTVVPVTGDSSATIVGASASVSPLKIYARADAVSISSTIATAGGASVSWPAQSAASLGNAALRSYLVEVSSAGGSWNVVNNPNIDTSTATHQLTLTSLTAGVATFIRISAVTDAGTGNGAVTTVTPIGVPSKPRAVNASAGNTKVNLSWQPPSSNNGTTIVGYVIKIETSTTRSILTGSTGTNFELTGLTNGTTYTMSVAACVAETCTVSGELGAFSDTLTIVPATTSGWVESVTATSNNGSIDLKWYNPTNNGGSTVIEFAIDKSADGNSWTSVGANVAFNNSASYQYTTNITTTNGTTYFFKITPINSAGSGTPRTITAKSAGLASKPETVTAVTSNRQIALSWNVPTSDGGSVINNYRVNVETSTGSVQYLVGTASTGYQLTNLNNGTTYTIKVQAITGAGDGAWSDTITSTPATLAGVVETLTASTGAASGKIVLTWNLPNGAVAGDISSYLIETSTNGVAWSTHSNQSRSINGQNNTINVDITGLTDSQNYFFRVSAVTSAGTGAGAVVSAVPTGPPAAPKIGRAHV